MYASIIPSDYIINKFPYKAVPRIKTTIFYGRLSCFIIHYIALMFSAPTRYISLVKSFLLYWLNSNPWLSNHMKVLAPLFFYSVYNYPSK